MTMTPTEATEFTVNGASVTVRTSHPHLLAALREELDVTSPKDGCSPSGQCGACTVLVDGKPIQSCLVSMEKAEGKEVTTLEGFDRSRSAPGSRAPLPQPVRCSAGSAPRHPGAHQGAARPEGQRSHEGDGGRSARRPPLPLHRVHEDLRSDRDAARRRSSSKRRRCPTASAKSARSTRPRSWRSAIGATSTTCGSPACSTPHSASPTTHGQTCCASTPGPALAVPGVVAVYTAADVPGEQRVGIIHTDWPVFIGEGHAPRTSATCLPSSSPKTSRPHARPPTLIDVEYDVLQGLHRPDSGPCQSDEDAVWGLDGNVLSRFVYAGETSMRRSRRAPTRCRRPSSPSGSSTPSWSRSRPSRCPARTAR